MKKRSRKELRRDILQLLYRRSPLTYSEMERKLKTNPESLRDHCEDLALFNAVRISRRAKHKANGRPYYEIEITSSGKKILKKLES